MSEVIKIAIDGPSGVGKSTIAKRLSAELGYVYIDTGAMFRALGVYFLGQGITPEALKLEAGKTAAEAKMASEAKTAAEAKTAGAEFAGSARARVISGLDGISLDMRYDGGMQHMIVNGEDVTDRLRTEEVSAMASIISQYPEVREKLLQMQRSLAAAHSCIMDGRDIGTVVLPDAQLKIFLTASARVRAERRYKQLAEAGKLEGATFESILKDQEERDYRDTHRAIAPLKAAEDSVIVDTSELTIAEVVAAILGELNSRTGAR